MPSFLKHGFWELIRVCKASPSLTELSPWPVFPLLYTESVGKRVESCSLKGTGWELREAGLDLRGNAHSLHSGP